MICNKINNINFPCRTFKKYKKGKIKVVDIVDNHLPRLFTLSGGRKKVGLFFLP